MSIYQTKELKKFKDFVIPEGFYMKNDYRHIPRTMNLQFNEFFKNIIILKLVKLSNDTIKEIIGTANEAMYNTLLNCIFIKLNSAQLEILQNEKYKELFNKYLKDKNVTDPREPTITNVYYVKDLINYFIETHENINRELTIKKNSVTQDIKTVIEKHLNLCKVIYETWRGHINTYYGRSPDEVFETAAAAASAPTSPNLYQILYQKKNIINEEYNKLNESAITTYLKIRCDKDKYNETFNVFVEPVEDRKTIPQSMYLTGPDPNHRQPFYKGELKIDNTENENLIIDSSGNYAGCKRFDYGLLLGPFTRIFTPEMNNKEISEQVYEIKNKLFDNKNPTSVCIFGYGASGAGKTSSLVYNKNGKTYDEKNGLLPNLLSSDEFKSIDEIIVTVHELFSSEYENGIPKLEKREYNNIKFTKDSGDNNFYINDPDDTHSGTYTEKVRTRLTETEKKEERAKVVNNIKNVRYKGTQFDDYRKTIDDNDIWKNEIDLEAIDVKWVPTKYKWIIKDKEFTGAIDEADGVTSIDPRMVLQGEELVGKIIIRKTEELLGGYKNSKYTKYIGGKDIKIKEYIKPTKKDEKTGKFIYDRTEPRYKLDTTPEQIISIEELENNYIQNNLKIKELKDLILLIIDRLRNKNPTTNNPESSRSHLIIYLNFNGVYLIICDLAGIENKFNCDTKETQAQFLKLREIDKVSGSIIGESSYYTVNEKLKSTDLNYGINDKYKKEVDLINRYYGFNPKNLVIDDNYLNKMVVIEFILNKPKSETATLPFVRAHYEASIAIHPELHKMIPKTPNADIITFTYSDDFINSVIDEVIKNTGIIEPEKGKFKQTLITPAPELRKILLENMTIIKSNLNNLQKSGIKELCTDRKVEGELIVSSLEGQKKETQKLVENLSSDKALIKNIPLVKESCFEKFCNKDFQNCFSQLKDEDTKPNSAIFEDIRNVIGDQIESLALVIFSVLNINRTANDPPVIPFIDLSNLLEIRDRYLTYRFNNMGENIDKEIREVVYREYTGNYSTVIIDSTKLEIVDTDLKSKSIGKILNDFASAIGADIVEECIELVKKIIKSNDSIFANLNTLIKKIEIIDSVSVIGTMVYINNIKNAYKTDQLCSMIIEKDNIPNGIDVEKLNKYKSVMELYFNNTKLQSRELGEMLYYQMKYEGKNSEHPNTPIDETDPHISPALASALAPAGAASAAGIALLQRNLTKSEVNIIDFIGGYLDKLQKNRKY